MRILVLLLSGTLPACIAPAGSGKPSDSGTSTQGGDTGDSTASDTGTVPDGCRSTPRDADAPRVALVSLPYTDDLDPSADWAVLDVGPDGLTDRGTRVPLGWDRGGGLAFTPDGSIGITALDDGTLGVVAVEPDGTVSVVQSGFDPGTYTTALAVDPSGEVVWLVNPNWPESGGGLYRAGIDCTTGAIGPAQRVVEAKNPAAIVLASPDRGLLVGREIPGAGSGADVALLDLDSGAVITGVDAFGDEDAIVSHAALSGSDWLLIADHAEFSGIPNRIASVRVERDGLGASGLVPNLLDPMTVVPNPVGPGALVPSGYGDRYWLLDEDSTGWSLAGTVASNDPAPVQLPEHAVAITRGALAGRVLAVEVGGIRSLDLDPAGTARLGPVLGLGSGYAGIPGALGVQP